MIPVSYFVLNRSPFYISLISLLSFSSIFLCLPASPLFLSLCTICSLSLHANLLDLDSSYMITVTIVLVHPLYISLHPFSPSPSFHSSFSHSHGPNSITLVFIPRYFQSTSPANVYSITMTATCVCRREE